MSYRGVRDYLLSKIKFGYGFSKELRRITNLYSISESELSDLKHQEFVKQYRNAFKNSKFYAKLYQEHGLKLDSVKSIDDAEKIPIITNPIAKITANAKMKINMSFVFLKWCTTV